MKWEEAMQELSAMIPQEAGYFTLEVIQFWHTAGKSTRDEMPHAPKVMVTIERGPEGQWIQIEGVSLKNVVEKVRYAYYLKVEAPAVIEGLDTIEAESGTEEEPNPAGEVGLNTASGVMYLDSLAAGAGTRRLDVPDTAEEAIEQRQDEVPDFATSKDTAEDMPF